MSLPQPLALIQTYNFTVVEFVVSSIKPKRINAMDMRFHWIKDRVSQHKFLIYWRPGLTNLGDYFTKHYAPSHHVVMRPKYLYQALHLCIQALNSYSLRGCTNKRIST